MRVVIYPPIKELGQSAYRVDFISGNTIVTRIVPYYRINKYIDNIITVSKETNSNIKFKIKEI